MDILKINVPSINNIKSNKQTKSEIKEAGLKEDKFQSSEKKFNLDNAIKSLSDVKGNNDKPKFNESDLADLKKQLEQNPKKWDGIERLAKNGELSSTIVTILSKEEPDKLNILADIAEFKDKDNQSKFWSYQYRELQPLDTKQLENVKTLINTSLISDSIITAVKENFSDYQKLEDKVNQFENILGTNQKGLTFKRNPYEKNSYILMGTNDDNVTKLETFGEDLKCQTIEKTTQYKSNNNVEYIIKKTQDLRNNTTTKTRLQKDTLPRVTHEVRIVKDKNGKVLKTEYTQPSDVKEIYNIKTVYPNGKTEMISSGKVDPKTGITTIKKNMVSSDGTRTEYLFEDDPQGNRISDYKITDKNGKVLLDNSRSFEVISENKFISSKNDQKYEISFDDKSLKVKDMSSDKETVLKFDKYILGNREYLLKILKQVPGDELIKMQQSVAKIKPTYSDLNDCFNHIEKSLTIGTDNLFIILHELGHATDYRDMQPLGKKAVDTKLKTIFENEKLNKIFEEEKSNFNENYPLAQRQNIDYFINEKSRGQNNENIGLMETIAEANALLTTPKQSEFLSIRSQYLQHHFPKTIAMLDNLLNTYKQVKEPTIAQDHSKLGTVENWNGH